MVSCIKVFKGMHDYGGTIADSTAYRLRYHMAEHKISQAHLARVCGCSRDTIYAYVNGECREENMNISVLKKAAVYFGKPPYYFCNEYLKFIDTTDVSGYLKAMRKESGMTQAKFAELYDIPLVRYKGYETGKVRLPFVYWKRLFPHSEP